MYFSTGAIPIPAFQSGGSPWGGGGLPGPVPIPKSGPMGPATPASLFPTSNLKWGDVVNVTGPFQGLFQGQVRVKFAGAPWQAPAITGPFSASVMVPKGAQTGICAIEINGRRVFGRQCTVQPSKQAMPREMRGREAWHDFGEKSMGEYLRSGLGFTPITSMSLLEKSKSGCPPIGWQMFEGKCQPDDYVAKVIAQRQAAARAEAQRKAALEAAKKAAAEEAKRRAELERQRQMEEEIQARLAQEKITLCEKSGGEWREDSSSCYIVQAKKKVSAAPLGPSSATADRQTLQPAAPSAAPEGGAAVTYGSIPAAEIAKLRAELTRDFYEREARALEPAPKKGLSKDVMMIAGGVALLYLLMTRK